MRRGRSINQQVTVIAVNIIYFKIDYLVEMFIIEGVFIIFNLNG